MESTNELSVLNEKDFPTLYKLYNEGISFRNNFSPRNNCSTGNNEFTTLTSMFTINNTCTADCDNPPNPGIKLPTKLKAKQIGMIIDLKIMLSLLIGS